MRNYFHYFLATTHSCLVWLLLIVPLLVFNVEAKNYLSDCANNPAYDSAMYLLVRQEYVEAKKVLDKCIIENPSDIDALYLSFAIEQTRILDYESYNIEQKKFYRFADSLKTFFSTQLSILHGQDSVRCLFYLANVYGGIGIMQAKTGNWLDAAKNAVNSVSKLKQVRKIDNDFYAAYLGLGIFRYYLKNSFEWLPFIKDDDEDELKTIEIALKADFPYNYAAKNSLCWILIEKDQYRKSDSLAQSVLNEVPNNTIFLRIRLMIALWTQQYETAIAMAKPFISLTLAREPRNWSDFVAGYAVLVSGYNETGDITASKRAAEYILAQKIPSDYSEIPHVKRNLNQIKAIKQKHLNGETNK